jgi:MFS family permease
MTHGRIEEAERLVAEIERSATTGNPLVDAPARIQLIHRRIGMLDVFKTLLHTYPRRSLLCLVLMASQAFFYNAIFFTYALVLGRYFGIPDDRVGLYILPFAAGNFLGPLLLGRLFDVIGRKTMISITYAMSGALLLLTAWLFANGMLDVTGQTIAWSVVFFFASAAASSAYLTIGEAFPLEMRALAIALFYALGTLLGGAIAPYIFSVLTATGNRSNIAWGYVFGAVLMLIAAAFALRLGVAAERKSLEDVAAPLSTHKPTTY